jgi:acyl carrier protein
LQPQAVAPAVAMAAPAADDAPTPLQAIVHEAVLAWLRSEKPLAQHVVDFDTPFTSLGMDSLATVSIAVDIETRTGIPIVPEVLYDYQTVHALSAYLAQRPDLPAAA